MTISEISIISILVVSLTANIAYALFNRRLGKYTFRWDLFRWISAYQLFSMTPRHFRVFYRDKPGNNEITDWREVSLAAPRKWFHPVFYPERLTPDTIYSFVDDLIRFQEAGWKPAAISGSFQYQTVLHFIRRFPSGSDSLERQFKIEETGGYISGQNSRELFISGFHTK